jgi:hypothetical protein
MTTASGAALAAQTTGRVWTPDSTDMSNTAHYDRERSGFNLSLDHRPRLVLAAETLADVAVGIRYAADNALPVDIQATGHGAHRALDGGLLITTRQLSRVVVDPTNRTARVSAGSTAADVITATAPHGLAAPVGAAPGVGFVSYSLGGGLGLLGRKHGWSADHIRSLQVVTADGRELVVTPDQHPDLFWGLRGGGGNLAAVTEIEVDLIPVAQLYGGGLFFRGEQAADLLDLFQQCTAEAPDELSLSVAFIDFPDLPAVPAPIRGRFCGHLRVTHLDGPGGVSETERLLAPFRQLGPMLDSIRTLPLIDLGSVHADPADPRPVHSDSVALRNADSLEAIAHALEPGASFMLELRHLGGALADVPDVPNAVGHRDAQYNLFTSAYPGTNPTEAAAAQRRVYRQAASAGVGGALRTFLPSQYPDATACYEPAIARRLAALKLTWDHHNLFSYAPAVSAPSTKGPLS